MLLADRWVRDSKTGSKLRGSLQDPGLMMSKVLLNQLLNPREVPLADLARGSLDRSPVFTAAEHGQTK